MAKITEFSQAGKAFCLTAWHDEEKGRNCYRVEFPGNDQRITYDELLALVDRMSRDMIDMFFRYQDGRLDNDLVNQLESDWRKPEGTENDEEGTAAGNMGRGFHEALPVHGAREDPV